MIIQTKPGVNFVVSPPKPVSFEKVNDKRWHLVFTERRRKIERKIPVKHVVNVKGGTKMVGT